MLQLDYPMCQHWEIGKVVSTSCWTYIRFTQFEIRRIRTMALEYRTNT